MTKKTQATYREQVETLSILLLEDDEAYRKVVTTVLDSSTAPLFRTHEESELRGALMALRNQEFDLIIADLNLPDNSGLGTFLALRAEADDTPIMILSAYEEDVLAMEAVQAGAQDYINKRKVTPTSLLRSVRYSIERSRSERERARLSAVQDFMGTLGHDMKVPLLGAARVLELLLEGHVGQLTEDQAKLISILQSSNRKLLDLVQRLLDAYRFESLEKRPAFEVLDLEAVLREAIEKEKAAQGASTVRLEIALSEMKPVFGNREWLLRMFANLLNNAYKFSPPDGVVRISAWMEDSTNNVSIEDQGKGLTADKARLFRRFWQGEPGKNYVAETGLGLYICQLIARAHRAKVNCHSTEGRGSTFTVLIPFMAE